MKIQLICGVCGWVGEPEETFYAPVGSYNVDCCPKCSDGTEPETWTPLMSHWIEGEDDV